MDVGSMRSGICLLAVAMLLTPAVDGVAKTLSADLPAMTIAFLRYLVAGLVALGLAAGTGRRIVVPATDRTGQVLRTALIMGAMTALIAALGLVPMAKAVGGFLIAPIVSGLLGILLWREPPSFGRLAGATVSFAGAAMLLRPETGLEPGCLLALLGGALLGAYLAAERGAGGRTDPLSTLAVQSLLGAGMLAPFALAAGLPAATPGLLGGALALGSLSAICHLLTVAAYARAEATTLAPFLYFNLLTAMAAGYLWFGETLGWTSLAGLSAIAAGGLLTLADPRLPALGLPRLRAA
jgi:drug/metabolite transporter (DMT)-like permease